MIMQELNDFRSKLLKFDYYRRRQLMKGDDLNKEEASDLHAIYTEISVSAGKYAPLVKEYTGLETIPTSTGLQDIWNWAFSFSTNTLVLAALDHCIQATSRTIGAIEEEIEKGTRDKSGNRKVLKTGANVLKAFIAHEGMTTALDKLEEFLNALGIKYSIAEKEPSDGRQIEGQVTSSYEKADFVIILATKGKAINRKTRQHYMGLNVADELGRARAAKKRVILLLQKGVEPHTNISGIVNERFTPQSMDKAFIKIVRELKNWNFIRIGKVKTNNNANQAI